MPEESLETAELKESLEEQIERLEGGEDKRGPSWTMYLSLSTAITAVLAAVASLQSGAFANEALFEKNEAVLAQAKASDQWAYFQAKSVKAAISSTQAEVIVAANPEVSAKLREDARRYKEEQVEIEKTAHEHEAKAQESNKAATERLEKHHKFAISVTVFQIAIALSAIAALTKKKPLWYAGMGGGLLGIVYFALGYVAR